MIEAFSSSFLFLEAISFSSVVVLTDVLTKVKNIWFPSGIQVDNSSNSIYTRSLHNAIFGTGKNLHQVNFTLSEYSHNANFSTSATLKNLH